LWDSKISSRYTVGIPLRIMTPLIYSTIVYYTVGVGGMGGSVQKLSLIILPLGL
jgi:hypothetical protein